MDTIKHAVKSVKHKGQAGGAAASKETNKTIAKDSNVRMSTRLSAAKNAVSDKMNESSHKRQAEGHTNAAKHNY